MPAHTKKTEKIVYAVLKHIFEIHKKITAVSLPVCLTLILCRAQIVCIPTIFILRHNIIYF
jgi:hypothetical protein